MDSLIPDNISYLILLEALAFKRFVGFDILDLSEFSELVIDLAGLHSQVYSQQELEPGSLPYWITHHPNP